MKTILATLATTLLVGCGPVSTYYPTDTRPSNPPTPVPSVCTDTIPASCN